MPAKYQLRINEVHTAMEEQAGKHNDAVVRATKEADNRQGSARRIVAVLNNIKSDTAHNSLKQVVDAIRGLVEIQSQTAAQVKADFEAVRANISNVGVEAASRPVVRTLKGS